MKTLFVFTLPLLAMLGSAHASDEVSPAQLAQIQAECADFSAKQTGLDADQREYVNWVCVGSLRDYDNSTEE